ncbi:MAG: hypothetical protein KDD36_07810 [Flavobacteriales bacterium]|nr:hypothetical protein [Flavobacteriales bacterium]
MKKVMNILAVVVAGGAIIAAMGFVSNERKQVTCKDIEVLIQGSDAIHFLDEKRVRLMLMDMGELILNKRASEIPLSTLEARLRNNPYVKEADLYMTLDGILEVSLQQREPIARIMTGPSKSYYIDREGYLMPPPDYFTAHVPVINGHFSLPFHSEKPIGEGGIATADSSLIRDLYALAKYVHDDPFWNSQVVQIYVNRHKEIELIPRVGDHRILLGNVEDMNGKLDKLRVFYNEGLRYTDWNQYSTINLKYKNQIICTKR